MKPNFEHHKNPALTDEKHPVIDSFTAYTSRLKVADQRKMVQEWMGVLGLVPTPELEVILSAPLLSVMQHESLCDIREDECSRRVLGVGSVLLQLLSVQHELWEPLNLNGDRVHDVLDKSVVHYRSDGDEALVAVFTAVSNPNRVPGASTSQKISNFNRDHTIFDKTFRPPTLRRDRCSHFMPTEAIPATVPPEAIPATVPRKLKRKAAQTAEGPKGKKQAKTETKEGKGVARKKASPTPPTANRRVLRSRKAV
ncbi:hypothetical protein DFH09DRAFT_1323208 [Mycena vulgaris]|nr:hypothetical protein DFH09DRAFT_1323208 [Mycena vulgaris]